MLYNIKWEYNKEEPIETQTIFNNIFKIDILN